MRSESSEERACAALDALANKEGLFAWVATLAARPAFTGAAAFAGAPAFARAAALAAAASLACAAGTVGAAATSATGRASARRIVDLAAIYVRDERATNRERKGRERRKQR